MELIGRRFGHIRVTEVVGQGGMGDVYAGYDEKLERKVALKVLNPDQRLDDEARERLLREARALSKLEHPNICRIHDYIETGDVDLLVLEYIDGRTLHDALIEKMPRGEKLRIAAAIAEVMVKAHRAGIVHRDLKPENVMLTKTGEVKVLDFGLARWLTRAKKQSSDRLSAIRMRVKESPEPAAAPAETMILPPPLPAGTDRFHSDGVRREFLATAVGITLGTPIFMSPEQARGESLTPASDMFSFGLLLQTLFTGQDPHPMGLTAREVILRVARGETLPVQGAPGDVTALINRLKQFAPADRPTALEALERLRMMEEKPQRIARRAIIGTLALIALLGAWRYTVDLKAERALAVAARAEADRRRAQAEDLINFMVGDLRKKLEPVGRLEVLDDVAEKALQYLGGLKIENSSAGELLAQAKALNQLGEVRQEQGKLAAARALFHEALRRAEAAVSRDPRNDDARFHLALTRFWLANTYRLEDDVARALPHALVYLSTTSDLARRNPSNDTYVLEESYAHSLHGLLLEGRHDYRGAISEYQKTLAIKNAYAARRPDDDAAKEDVARTINKVGFALWKRGDLQEARARFESEVAMRERLVARNAKQMRWKSDLAVAHSFLSTILEDLGEVDAALRHRAADVTLHGELSSLDPTNTTWARNLAIAYNSQGRLLVASGDRAGALRAFQRSEKALAELLKTDPSRSLWRTDIGRTRHTLARFFLAAGRTDAARGKAEEAVRGLRDINDAAGKRMLGNALITLGYVREAEGNGAEARLAWTSAAELVRPDSPDVRQLVEWARVLIALDRRNEGAEVVARLRSVGFRNPEFESLTRSEGY